MTTRMQTRSRPGLRFSENGTVWIPPDVTEAFMEQAWVERALAASQVLRCLLTLIRVGRERTPEEHPLPSDTTRYQITSMAGS